MLWDVLRILLIVAIAIAACVPRTGEVIVANAVPVPPVKTPAVVRLAMMRLASATWGDVWNARVLLAAHREAALPALVEMIAREDRVELVETADLIYPGARAFHGHGMTVPYDLDHLGDRAGWVLEELVLRDFGFSDGVQVFAKEDAMHAMLRRKHARAAVAAWWARARDGRTCATTCATTRTIEAALAHVALLSETSTVAELEETLGPHFVDVNGTIHVFGYDFDGRELSVGTRDGVHILYVRDGDREVYPR